MAAKKATKQRKPKEKNEKQKKWDFNNKTKVYILKRIMAKFN